MRRPIAGVCTLSTATATASFCTWTPTSAACPRRHCGQQLGLRCCSDPEPNWRHRTRSFPAGRHLQGSGPGVPRGTVKYLRVCQEVRADLIQMSDGSYQSDHEPFQDWYATPIHKVPGPNGWPTYVAKGHWESSRWSQTGRQAFRHRPERCSTFRHWTRTLTSCSGCAASSNCSPANSAAASVVTSIVIPLLRCSTRLRPAARRADSNHRPGAKARSAYEQAVQPVWNKHCVRCHDATDQHNINFTGTLDNDRVPASYRTLIEGGWVHYFDMTYQLRHHKADPATFGTLASKLWQS